MLPVMITALKRSEIEAEIAGAREQGILVITREGIDAAIDNSFWFPTLSVNSVRA